MMATLNRLAGLALVAALGLLLSGCSGQVAADTPSGAKESPTVTTVQRVLAPDVTRRTRIALVRGSYKVKVGDDWDSARKIFSPPRGSYDLNDLPPNLNAQEYRARGWETATEGFGVITYNDRIAMAMSRLEKVQEDRLEETLDTCRELLGKPTDAVPPELILPDGSVPKDIHARYWFWQIETQRMMVCAVLTPADGLSITVAIGDANTMDALGMSVDAAKTDQAQAEKALSDPSQGQSAQ